MRLKSFRALRPLPDLASKIASLPYDVVNRDEARALAAVQPLSFLHVVRAEIDLPDNTDPYDDAVYARARTNLQQLRESGALLLDDEPAIYVYRLTAGDHQQTGIVGCVHIDDYSADVIKKHEKTRQAKENDRTRHILALDADAEAVILTYHDNAAVDEWVDRQTEAAPLIDFTADDGVRHTVWRSTDCGAVVSAFAGIPSSYVADGHHRCASAWRAGMERRNAASTSDRDAEYNWFPAALFPAGQLRILPYNRVVIDHPARSPNDILAALAQAGTLTADGAETPRHAGSFSIYVGGDWHTLELDPDSIDHDDPVHSLDVDLLQSRVLEPIFGIADPRTDPRIDFVGGIRGSGELVRRVEDGQATVAISMFPTTVDQLMTVADSGEVMPPKSTWFEPKLRSGLFVHYLDEPE